MPDEAYRVREALQTAIMAAADERFASDERVVYFVQAGDIGPVKIGYSSKFSGVRLRIAAIQTGCPWPVLVRRVMRAEDGQRTELALHDHFRRDRLAGEWFTCAPELAELAHAMPSGDVGIGVPRLLTAAYDRGFEVGRAAGRKEECAVLARDMQELAAAFDVRAERHAHDMEPRGDTYLALKLGGVNGLQLASQEA